MIRSEKRTIAMLACSQGLAQTASVMVMTLAAIVGSLLADDKRLSTLPVALMMVGTASTMIPASFLMQRYGRRTGFLLGTLFCCLAGLLASLAVVMHEFWLFVLASIFVGSYQGFAQYYRFTAADIASPAFKSKAISWVISGGVFAALAGPTIANHTKALNATPYLGSYLALLGLGIIAMALVSQLKLPPMRAERHESTHARPLIKIIQQPVFITALISSTVGFAAMSMLMTATPLAMEMCGLPLDSSSVVIQWHVLGMYIPSFFTGGLIRRFGVTRILIAGILAFSLHLVIAFHGTGYYHFLSGLILVGIGWNFLFIGGTSLLTESYQPSERAKTQATHDFIMLGLMSLSSFGSGVLLNTWGWNAVNYATLPMLIIAITSVAYLGKKQSASSWRGTNIR